MYPPVPTQCPVCECALVYVCVYAHVPHMCAHVLFICLCLFCLFLKHGIFYLFFSRVLCSPAWPPTRYTGGMTLNLLCHRCVSSCPAYGVPGIEPMALCMLAKHATRQLGCITSPCLAFKAKGLVVLIAFCGDFGRESACPQLSPAHEKGRCHQV